MDRWSSSGAQLFLFLIGWDEVICWLWIAWSELLQSTGFSGGRALSLLDVHRPKWSCIVFVIYDDIRVWAWCVVGSTTFTQDGDEIVVSVIVCCIQKLDNSGCLNDWKVLKIFFSAPQQLLVYRVGKKILLENLFPINSFLFLRLCKHRLRVRMCILLAVSLGNHLSATMGGDLASAVCTIPAIIFNLIHKIFVEIIVRVAFMLKRSAHQNIWRSMAAGPCDRYVCIWLTSPTNFTSHLQRVNYTK